MNHILKIWPQYYSRVSDGSKTFEVRNNDRGFQSGDTVTLREWNPDPINATSSRPKGFTGAPDLNFTIGYVHVLNSSEVIFSLLPLDGADKMRVDAVSAALSRVAIYHGRKKRRKP